MNGLRILLVEDDDGHRRTLERHLTRTGWKVTAAEDGDRGLGAFSEARADVVLTDVRMPGMDGLELLRRVREHSPVPVIVMTAFSDMRSAIDAMKLGAYDYLTKPLDLDALDGVLHRCVDEHLEDGKQSRSEPVASYDELVGTDPRMLDIYKTIGSIATTRAPVLIRGETGTGKELIARTIHTNSPTADEPFVAINCTAVPENLLESELFGHVRGSFTGAVGDRKGRFELAGEGTIFLDEIGDTSLAFQSKLLRVLQEKEFYPVGGERPRVTNARIIAATHRPIEELVRTGTFREDLYFRLRVVEIVIPPLRERCGDIPLLVRHIIGRVEAELERKLNVPHDVMKALLAHDWPGNVRELENALVRAAVMARGPAIAFEHLGLGTDAAPMQQEEDSSLEAVEKAHVQRVLLLAGRNKSRAARMLGVSRPRLDRIIARHGLTV
jgi:DNA-binding NtrC family response regulator